MLSRTTHTVALQTQSRQFTLTLATLCSGTDFITFIMDDVWDILSRAFLEDGVVIRVRQKFARENQPRKQDFLRPLNRCRIIFEDVTKLSGSTAWDVVGKSMMPVTNSNMAYFGFECDDASNQYMLRGRDDLMNCVATGTRATGSTFSGGCQYVEKHEVSMLGCENVPGLASKGGWPKTQEMQESG